MKICKLTLNPVVFSFPILKNKNQQPGSLIAFWILPKCQITPKILKNMQP